MSGVAAYARADRGVEELVERHAASVQRVARHLLARLPPSVQIEDMIQAGMLGLLEAARRYDPGRGVDFRAFAERRIRGAMLDEIRRGDWAPRSVHRKAREVSAAVRAVEAAKGGEASDREIAAELGLALSDYHALLTELRGQKLLSVEELVDASAGGGVATTDDDPCAAAQRAQLLELMAAGIDGLPEREQLVLALYYDEGLNLKEIGLVLEVSESRVSQLHGQALARLRARLQDRASG